MLVPKAVSLAFRLQVLSTFALAASLPIHDPPPASTISLSAPHNPVLLTNLSLLSSPPLNILPFDPIFYKIPGSSLFIRLHDYGSRLSTQSTYRTLRYAVQDVLEHVSAGPSGGGVPMARQFPGYVYQADDVRLQVQSLPPPTPAMTWGMWGDALRGLRLFGERWEFVVLMFDIWEEFDVEGEKRVGTGHLWLVE